MSGEMRVLGINRTTDASICLLTESSVWSIQKERLSRKKYDRGRLDDFRQYYSKQLEFMVDPIDLVVECYSSDQEIEHLDQYHIELDDVLASHQPLRKVQISHHLAHLFSTYQVSSFRDSAVIVSDFMGSQVSGFTESWPHRESYDNSFAEVTSYYYCQSDNFTCLSKQLWNMDHSHPVGIGPFYNKLTKTIFASRMEGQVMGLAPYGNPHALGLPALEVVDGQVFIPRAWLEIFSDKSRFQFFKGGSGSFDDCANLAAAGQKCFEEALLEMVRYIYSQTGSENLCLTGGTALNCVANARVLRDGPFKSVFIPPWPHDGGTALGCAMYGAMECLNLKPRLRQLSDFLGPALSACDIESALNDRDLIVEKPDCAMTRVVDLLTSGCVVALYQGRSELGPRALGHRSVLADPRNPKMRDFINFRIKSREWFRPLAPAALAETAARYFEVQTPVPFMELTVSVKAEYRPLLPAITHVDGSARLQTVTPDDDPIFYQLLKKFEDRTGYGVLLNTSLNRKGEPVIETFSEAISCLKNTDLHALFAPPYIIQKVSSPPVVQ
jgi:carbamoyltransferase